MSRHCYVLWFSPDVFCALMGGWRHHQYIAMPWLQRCADATGKMVELPTDYEVVDATYSWERRAIGLRLRHPSFPETEPGMEFPSLYYREVTIEYLPIKNPTDDEDAPGPIIVEVRKT